MGKFVHKLFSYIENIDEWRIIMKHWRKGLKRITAVALAVMMIGTTVNASALAVLAAEEVTEVTCNHVCDETCGGTETATGSALTGCTHVHDETCGYECPHDSYTDGVCDECGDECTHEDFVNGFCRNGCAGCYESAQLNNEGYYEISNAGQLYWFAKQVNNGNSSIHGKLMADIVVNPGSYAADGSYTPVNGEAVRAWTPIGNEDVAYSGIFDGNYKTVSGLYFNNTDATYVGLFGHVADGTVYNVGVLNSYLKGLYCVGGIAGTAFGAYIVNCYSTAFIFGASDIGGIVGDNMSGSVTDCYSAGSVDGDYSGGIAGHNAGAIINCYYLAGSASGGIQGTDKPGVAEAKTAQQFASGEVTHLLNGSQNNGIWKQTVNKNDLPGFTGATVYAKWSTCGAATYSNNPGEANERPAHDYGEGSNGFCKVCDLKQEAVRNNEAVYEISNAGQLYWFAEQVNNGNRSIHGKLMADIIVNPGIFAADGSYTPVNGESIRTWTPIGGGLNGYRGTFDGNYKTVSGLYYTGSRDEIGLFGYVLDGTVKNVGVVNSYLNGGIMVGGVAGFNGINGRIENCYSNGFVSGNDTIGGVAGQNYGSIRNCYFHGSVSGNFNVGGIAGFRLYDSQITGCYYLADSETDTFGGTAFMTAQQFASGEVAYLLNGSKNNGIWKQTIGSDAAPNFSGEAVYYGYISCAEDAQAVYSNVSSASETKPDHSDDVEFVDNGDGETHDGKCAVCGQGLGNYVGRPHVSEEMENKATCNSKAVCDLCGASYGEVDENNHSLSYFANGNTITRSCGNGCGYTTGTATISAEGKTYDGAETVVTVEKNGIFEEENFTVSYARSDGAVLDAAPVNAGTYIASITYTDAEGTEYVASAEFTINPMQISGANVTIRAEDSVYSGAPVSGNVSVYTSMKDMVEGEDFTLAYEDHINVGTATVTVTGIGNYTGESVLVFEIQKAIPAAITIPTATAITYGETLSSSVLDDSSWTWLDGTIVPDASTDCIAYIEVDDSNYDYTGVNGYDSANHRVAREISVQINRATLTITAKSYTIKVGSAFPTYDYTVTGLVGDDTLPVDVTVSCSAADSNAVGTYPITISGEVSDNILASHYAINYVDGTLIVSNKEEQTITASDVALTYGETGKKISATANGDGAITYTVATGTDVISVAADGTITVLKAGTATVTICAAETADYAAAAKTISVIVNKAENAPNMPSATMSVANNVKTVGVVTLPEGWAWKAEDASKTLTADEAVTAIAVYNGADKGNYETETVEVAITRSACNHTFTDEVTKQPTVDAVGERTYTCGICGYSYTEEIEKLETTVTPMPTATPTPTATPMPTATPTPTPVYGMTSVPTGGETVVDAEGKEVVGMIQAPGTTNQLVIPGLTDTKPEAGEASAPVVWKSSNPAAVEVDENGNLTMKEPGLAEITVTVGEGKEAKKETVVVLVKKQPDIVNNPEEAVEEVLLGTSAKDVPAGCYQQLGETVDINFYGVKNWNRSNYEYVWKSSDETVAKVDNLGRVTALKPGVATITLELKNQEEGHLLNVRPVIVVVPEDNENKILLGTSKSNTFESLELKLNQRIDINFYGVKNWKKDEYEYRWISSDTSVVWVDKVGKLTPVAPGKAEIMLILIEKKTGIPRHVVPMQVTVPEK